MTTHAAAASSATIQLRHRGWLTAPAAAGLAFATAWAAGLAVWPSNLNVAASGAQVVTAYAGHQGVAMTQYLLVEGVAAIALAIVVLTLGRAGSRRGAERAGRVVLLAGGGAVIVSLLECFFGLLLATGAVPDGETARAGALFHLINRLDGLKMLALAAVALAGVRLARRGGVVAGRLAYVAALLAVAMTTSGIGYLLLNNTVAQAAAASLGLLLIWVVATGVTLGHRSR